MNLIDLYNTLLDQLRAWVATEFGATTVGGILASIAILVMTKLGRRLFEWFNGDNLPVSEEVKEILSSLNDPDLWEVNSNGGARHLTRRNLVAFRNGVVQVWNDNKNGAASIVEMDISSEANYKERRLLKQGAISLHARIDEIENKKSQEVKTARLKPHVAGLREDREDLSS